ncbi:nucleosome assembly protein 1-like 1 [Teleopsis dalmanni]|uniref:nucleosome assembly protein 1-like 1 n=1 Tax=Teleopsis dalmanni TaxID=139649 RepID=UPI0018CE83BD|nr:nucleosome assembly protein 1-like 1 [Teleopsis dalmanni]
MADSSNSNMDNVVKSSTESGSSSEASTFTDEKADKKVKKFQPALLDAAKRRHFLHEMVKSFPQSIKDRITVLKNIQLEQIAIDSEFYKELINLDIKYAAKYKKFYDQRCKIISGKFDPPKQVANWKGAVFVENAKGDYKFDDVLKEYKKISNNTIGIPFFWLTVLRNVDVIGHLIQKHDEPLLRKLTDIKEKYNNANSFTIEFHFENNDYFTNKVLTKKYTWSFKPDKNMSLQYGGPLICKSEGCCINWKKDMDITLETVKNTSIDDTNEMVFKNIPRLSFFHFFKSPFVQESESIDNDMKEILNMDYDLGLMLRSRIIPRAVLYFTGELSEFNRSSDYKDQSENDDSDDWDDSNESHSSNEEDAAGSASATTFGGV